MHAMVSRLMLVGLLLLVTACSAAPREQRTQAAPRDPAAARDRIEAGNLAVRLGDLPRAERSFRQAVAADPLNGVAHNNLGKVLYHQRRLFDAAEAFQTAARLLPDHPEPQNNMGLVFESAGQLDEAIIAYRHALAQAPTHPQVMGNLARARVRRGDMGEDLRHLFTELLLREDRASWLSWARGQWSRLGGEPTPPSTEVSVTH
jgi:Tfp pilus assembly protein PilF